MSSRNLNDLSTAMRRKCEEFLSECAQDEWMLHNGVVVLVTCTYRSPEEQESLYAQGRAKPGRIVTRARGGQSKHNKKNAQGFPASEAMDVVPLRHGKPVWGTSGDGIDDDPSDDHTDDLEVWQRAGEIGKRCGLKWYGDPGSPFREFAHFQNLDA